MENNISTWHFKIICFLYICLSLRCVFALGMSLHRVSYCYYTQSSGKSNTVKLWLGGAFQSLCLIRNCRTGAGWVNTTQLWENRGVWDLFARSNTKGCLKVTRQIPITSFACCCPQENGTWMGSV